MKPPTSKEEYTMLDESYYRKTDEIIARYGKEPKALIPVMQDVQAE